MGQKIFIFPTKHKTLVMLTGRPSLFNLTNTLLTEDSNRLKGPRLLMYTLSMPVILLYNVYTEGRLVNGL